MEHFRRTAPDLSPRPSGNQQLRTLARAVIAHGRADGGSDHHIALAKQLWPGDKRTLEWVTRAAAVPASTANTTAFSATNISELINLLGPSSASGALFALSMGLKFDAFNTITIPNLTTSASGVAFIGQGSPVVVRQYAFDSVSLSPAKVALAVGFTRELIESSNAEAMVQEVLRENLALGLDSIVLDVTASDGVRPSGLRNGVGAIGATTGSTNEAMITDLGLLIAAIAPKANNQIAIIAAPKQAAKIALRTPRPLPWPVLSSAGLADTVCMAVATNALAVASDEAPRIEVSREATLHFEDANPLQLTTVGTPNTFAAPIRSLYQTDAVAVRLIFECNWALRATANTVVSWITGTTW